MAARQVPSSSRTAEESAHPMSPWNRDALVSLREKLQLRVLMETGLCNRLEKAAGGFMNKLEAATVREQSGNIQQMGKVIDILCGKSDKDFSTFLQMLRGSNNEVWAEELEKKAKKLKRKKGAQPDHQPADPDGKAWFSTNRLAQKYLERVRDHYSEMSVTGEYPHLDYIPLRVMESHPSQHKKEDTVQFLKNFQRATVDFISRQDGGITSYDPPASGLLSHDHFLKKQEKPLHIVFGPPGTGKTSFSRHICSQFNSAHQSSSFSLVLLFYLREKRVAEAKTLSDLLSCYGLPDDLEHKELARLIMENKGRGIQIIFDGLDERQDLLKDETSIVTRLLKGELKEAQIVVTSRPGIVTQLSTLWHRASLYEVQGFSHQEVKQYIESFFLKEGNPSAAPELQSALADRPDLTGSTYIPLNLWLICSVFSFKNCTLPDTLTQCYTALFAQLLQHQAMKEGLETAVGDTLDTLPASMLATLDCLSQLSYLCYLKEELVFDEEVVIRTCLSSRAELKGTFDGMSLLHVHPKKHGAKDHLTFNFLHSTYQEYLCARHILTAMSEDEQTAFWKENISNPRFAMVFRFYCGLSELKVRGVQEIVKGQELPSKCSIRDRRLLFLFYALHESSNSHLTAAVAEQLHSELTFHLLLSPYDFYVMQYCLSKTTHLRRIRFRQYSTIYQPSEFAIRCISTVASTNALTSLVLGLSSFTLSDAQHLTAALVAVEDLDLNLEESSIEAVKELLLIPTLRQLKLRVTSFNDLQTSPRPRSVSNVSQLDLTLPPEGDACLARCIPNCPQLEELKVNCDSKGAGDVVAATLPNLKYLRKVTVNHMNPVPVLQTVGLCGKLQEVSVMYPTHCEPTTEDWCKVSSSVANAQHLQMMDLVLGGFDINFLQSILPCLASSHSLQELVVMCNASGAGDVAVALPNLKCLRKVTVCEMNPVPVLQTVGLCGKLQEVSVRYPKHCEATTEDWCKVSSIVANAQHLQKMDLRLGRSDINFLQSILPCLTSSQSLEELHVTCGASGAGDVVAAALPNLKCLRKVTVWRMNPVPVLQTVGVCGKLQEVSVWYPKHCEPTTEDWCKVSSSVANAQHLQTMDLHLGRSDINFLQSILPCLTSSQSLEELDVMCDASGAGEVLADRLLSLRSVEKLHIRDIDPAPVLSVLSENAGHCTVSTLGVAFEDHPELGVGVSDMLAKCKSIRSFELYLDKGPKSLAALNYWMEGVRDSPSIDNLWLHWFSESIAFLLQLL